METATIVNIALSILSFLLAAISVVTVIITLRQNREMLNNNEKQLLEMRKEHQLSVQPIIAIEDVRFQIERPRLFYTPPSDEYTFQSRYHLELKLHNISDATAVCVDAVAHITIPNEDEKYQTMTITHREKVIPAHSEVADICLGFNSDSDAVLFEGLRGNSAKALPKVVVHLTYKNAVSGCFEVSETFLVVPKETDDEIIRKWHTCMKSAPVETKEILEKMRDMPQNEKWDEVFQLLKQAFDKELGFAENMEIIAKCIEVDEEYVFSNIAEERYKKISQYYSYPRFIHKKGTCKETAISKS